MLWPIFAMALTAQAPLAQSCLQATDGNTIARVQFASESLIERLKPNPYYGGAWFEHQPCYRIVFALTNDDLRPAVIAAAPEHLRPYIGFARLNLSHAEREAASRAIRETIFPPGIDAVFIEGDPRQPFRIGVRTEADAAIVRSLIPERYRAITVVVPGGYAEPMPELFSAEPRADAPMPGEYVGPTDAEDREMYPKRATLGAAELQLFVVPLSRKVRNLPGFSDIYIEHFPRWHVVVAFTRPPPADKVIALAPRTIRDRIVIRHRQADPGADRGGPGGHDRRGQSPRDRLYGWLRSQDPALPYHGRCSGGGRARAGRAPRFSPGRHRYQGWRASGSGAGASSFASSLSISSASLSRSASAAVGASGCSSRLQAASMRIAVSRVIGLILAKLQLWPNTKRAARLVRTAPFRITSSAAY